MDRQIALQQGWSVIMRNNLMPAKASPYRLSVSRGRYQQHFEASRTRSFRQGEQVYSIGTLGICWRVISGSVRLNRTTQNGEVLFANLAVKDDVIGTETLLMGQYAFCAVALSDCELVPWPEGLSSASKDSLLYILAAADRRTADVVALRSGLAIDRVMRLIAMLAKCDENHDLCFALPKGQDISEITDLTKETISRTVSNLKYEGMIRKMKIPGHASHRNYIFCGSTVWSTDESSNRDSQA
ncbi:MAG: Crp/Fnr family transcriptional regulator [Burkholderiaceae bacterium]